MEEIMLFFVLGLVGDMGLAFYSEEAEVPAHDLFCESQSMGQMRRKLSVLNRFHSWPRLCHCASEMQVSNTIGGSYLRC